MPAAFRGRTPRPQLTSPRNRYVSQIGDAEVPESQAANVRNAPTRSARSSTRRGLGRTV
ncbi:hypothetical protein [Leifsonia shinshuensis]